MQPHLSMRCTVLLVCAHFCVGQVCLNDTVSNPDQELAYLHTRFPYVAFKAPTRSPFLGGQNITYCCLQAVDDYLRNQCTNDNQVRVDSRILEDGAQFSCGATYIGDNAGAPRVEVTYEWTTKYCRGWQLSGRDKANEWAQLLAAFILPSVVFSFNIPRPRKLRIWEKLFPTDLGSYRVIAGLGGVIISAICVTVDAVAWLVFSLAFAGPLLLSGLTEAILDKRVLAYLHEHIKHDELPLALRARILFTILCGNLDMYPAWCDTMDQARHLDKLDRLSWASQPRSRQNPDVQVSIVKGSEPAPSPDATEVARSGTSLGIPSFDRLSVDTSVASERSHGPRRSRSHSGEHKQPLLSVSVIDHSVDPHSATESVGMQPAKAMDVPSTVIDQRSSMEVESFMQTGTGYDRTKSIRKVIVRLNAMLACQYSFGTTIGGPIVFFLGSFIYTLLEIKQDIGDENIAEALAFGMWYTVLPHVATVAGLLLAGNNPSILEGIVSVRDFRYSVGDGLITRRLERRDTCDTEASVPQDGLKSRTKTHSGLMERVYKARYSPAWMWNRGKCKQDWLIVLFTDSWLKYQDKDGRIPRRVRGALKNFLTESVMLSLSDWIALWLFAFLLVLIPCLFGFLTAYYTPKIGIGCRSATLIIYMGAQTLLLLLWAYYLTFKNRYWCAAKEIKHIMQQHPSSEWQSRLEDPSEKLRRQAVKNTTSASGVGQRLNERGQNITGLLNDTTDVLTAWDKGHPVLKLLFWGAVAFGFVISLLTSIGGTLMQLIGVYRNTLCFMSLSDWTHRHRASTYVTLSTNTSDAIHEAQKDWIIIGSCSVIFLGMICYIGWWYQKVLRATFKEVTEKLEGYDDDDGDGRELDDMGGWGRLNHI